MNRKHTSTLNAIIEEYDIIVGEPQYVTQTIRRLLAEGWSLNGELGFIKYDHHQVVAQGVVKYKEEVDDAYMSR